jgi:flagellar hook protein FlgE
MLNSLNTGVSGMQQAQARMNVIGDNIANVNTTGFKSSRMTFQDAYSQILQSGGGGQSPIEIGSGVTTAATSFNWTEGQIATTELKTDLYISGDGFFMVKDPSTGEDFATRAGEFHIDQSTEYLVNNNGQRVQGYSDSGLTQQGDLKINGDGRPADASPTAKVSKVDIAADGRIVVTLDDGKSFTRGQVLLQSFRDPQALLRAGNNLYTGLASAGPEGLGAPKSMGLGALQAGALEMSNVDLATEFANLIMTQRAFQANARMITSSDELMQEMVNLVR